LFDSSVKTFGHMRFWFTGDVTDNATPEDFNIAAANLRLLTVKDHEAGQPKFRIVPGNHDRYELLGNRLFGKSKKWDYKKTLFEKTFPDGQMVTPMSAADLVLAEDDLRWRVRVIGLDSNLANWFAQGAIEETSAVEAGRSALAEQAIQSDLVIAMVHHHVLPIPEVERRAQRSGARWGVPGIAAVANVTGMLNAGVLLHHLSKSQVNIVLHGHEHIAHQAVFRDAALDAGPTVVLAAGSGTGEKTGEGWALDRVHFNVLELKRDRSVQLLQARYDGTNLRLHEGQVLLLGEDIRRARFIRRCRRNPEQKPTLLELPSSRLKTVVIVGYDRNADYVETTTNFLVDEQWSLTTRNPSGCVDSANVTFEWDEGAPTKFETPFIAAGNGNPEAFSCGVLQEAKKKPLVKRITAKWQWIGAIALTKQELDALPQFARTGLRAQSQECVSLSLDDSDEFESAALILHLPEEYAPDHGEFRVHFEDGKQPGQLQSSPELTEKLEFCGRGHIELRIPYPLPGFRYFLSWPPVDDSSLPHELSIAYSDSVAAKISAQAAQLFSRAATFIRGSLKEADVRIGLYSTVAAQHNWLRLLHGDSGNPSHLRLGDPRSRSRAALWGSVGVVESGRDPDSDLMGDERILALLPLRPMWTQGGRGAALLRVAILTTGVLNWDTGSSASNELAALFQRATSAATDVVRWVSE
jgi:3',5'-cyclic AMP phosphodiesterase CpdA